ncbi:conserved hypothetical protein [Hyella patelloides LEGE 07179]|uniref:Protein-L-isoaspartate O-methyltransferase n=2 Tax=Hyella TaxID=945733 RepID=A0A563W1P0_9CYAN|nr:conserved hypothetical protein [Hyella patelloides LEGE 07179]
MYFMFTAKQYQQKLLEKIQKIYSQTPISEITKQAYWAMPRHLFVKRYFDRQSRKWHNVNRWNSIWHLSEFYRDTTITLLIEDEERFVSTISQPSLVLYMLDLLQLKPGHKVFELGAGSGWNAAMISHIVGSEGHVYSLEIIPEVAKMASWAIDRLKIKNVSVINADGGEGYPAGAPYDRAIFAAGIYDLPCYFYEQIEEGGLLLMVIKNPGGWDNLFLLRKTESCFTSLESMSCGFVPVTGKYQLESLNPINIETIPEWKDLQHQEVSRMPFWWGWKGTASLNWKTMGIRSFLGITEPNFCTFKSENNEPSQPDKYFGLWEREHNSLVLAKDDFLIAYGSSVAKEHLLQKIREWVDLGMPCAANFKLKVYPIDIPLTANKNQWIVKRKDSQFLWSLK